MSVIYFFFPKLNIEEKSTNINSEEWKKSAFLVLFTATSITLTVADIVVCMDRANNKQFFTFLCSTMYFLGYLIAQILEVQFICICSEVNKNLKSLNDVLEEAGNAVRQQDKNVLIPTNYENVAANTICSAVDALMIKKRKRSAVTPSTPISPKMIPEVIHQFIMKYHRICAVVDSLSSCFGLELLVIITTCMMHLVSMPYHMILLMNKRGMQLHQLLLMVASCVWYVFRTIAMVEQGHTTEAEVERTSWLVSEIMLSSTDDEIQDELEKFSRYLLMNKVGYSLLGACTLNRGLALSIFGTVATYLVVIVQFQLSEQ